MIEPRPITASTDAHDRTCPPRCRAQRDRQSAPARARSAIWWLGQSGFLIKSRRGTAGHRPYLSEHLTKKYEGTAGRTSG